jgi:hypothetical protein
MGPPPRSFAPMRMTASWFRSSRIDRIQGCGAIFAPDGELPSNCRRLALQGKRDRPSQPAAVLVTVKGKPLRDGLRPPLTVTARGGQSKLGRDEEMIATWVERGDGKDRRSSLTIIAPYKGFG